MELSNAPPGAVAPVPIPPYSDEQHPYREFIAFLDQGFAKLGIDTGSAVVRMQPSTLALIGIKPGQHTYKGLPVTVEVGR
jgi:hypothetical protein